jgi:hypothetical protein
MEIEVGHDGERLTGERKVLGEIYHFQFVVPQLCLDSPVAQLPLATIKDRKETYTT